MEEKPMNKAGIISGCILLPFLFTLFMPWGKSWLGLYLFNDNGTYIGIFGVVPASLQNMALEIWVWTWWFTMTAIHVNQLLEGIVFWLFPLVACVLCFTGAKKPPEKGKRYYIAAFFLMLVAIILLVIDALALGALFISRKYTIVEFFGGINVGFYIYVFDMILTMFAGLTYKEA